MNILNIIVFIGLLIVAIIGFYIAKATVENLKPKSISYYPFGVLFPKSRNWSIIYFLVSLLLLFIIFYLFGDFPHSLPA